MKIILVLLDGLGDRSYTVLKNRTPLQAAATPNLDRLASLGGSGLFHASRPGQCLPSETAHYLLLGYELEEFPGRALLEAAGEGVVFRDRDVVCLANFSCVTLQNGALIITKRRDDIKLLEDEVRTLTAAVTPYETRGITFQLHHTRGNNAILIASGDVSPHVSDSDPMVADRAVARIMPLPNDHVTGHAKHTATALNDYLAYCHRVLSGHEINRLRRSKNLPPVNFLLTQRCGRRIKQESFSQRWGMTGMIIASQPLYRGLAQELGLSFFHNKDTDDPGGDLRERIRSALHDSAHDFVHVHTKAPDEAAHMGDPRQKEAVISALDAGMVELVTAVENGEDLLAVVTADHSTPSISGLIHSGEPVPVTIAGPTVRRDNVTSFDEVSAAGGCLGLLRGRELMLTLLNYTDRSALLGHVLGDAQKAYSPKNYEPFKLDR